MSDQAQAQQSTFDLDPWASEDKGIEDLWDEERHDLSNCCVVCAHAPCIDDCQECGGRLCPTHHELGAGFWEEHPRANYRPEWAQSVDGACVLEENEGLRAEIERLKGHVADLNHDMQAILDDHDCCLGSWG